MVAATAASTRTRISAVATSTARPGDADRTQRSSWLTLPAAVPPGHLEHRTLRVPRGEFLRPRTKRDRQAMEAFTAFLGAL
jgi:hypothetical protein